MVLSDNPLQEFCHKAGETKGNVLGHRHIPERPVVLKNKTNTTIPNVNVGHILTTEPDGPNSAVS